MARAEAAGLGHVAVAVVSFRDGAAGQAAGALRCSVSERLADQHCSLPTPTTSRIVAQQLADVASSPGRPFRCRRWQRADIGDPGIDPTTR